MFRPGDEEAHSSWGIDASVVRVEKGRADDLHAHDGQFPLRMTRAGIGGGRIEQDKVEYVADGDGVWCVLA